MAVAESDSREEIGREKRFGDQGEMAEARRTGSVFLVKPGGVPSAEIDRQLTRDEATQAGKSAQRIRLRARVLRALVQIDDHSLGKLRIERGLGEPLPTQVEEPFVAHDIRVLQIGVLEKLQRVRVSEREAKPTAAGRDPERRGAQVVVTRDVAG